MPSASDWKSKIWGPRRDVRYTARLVVGTLLGLNVAAALAVFQPWGGSPEDLQQRLALLQSDVQRRQSALERSRTLTSKIQTARAEGDKFVDQFMLSRRTAYSTILTELERIADASNVKPKEAQFAVESIEGSDDSIGIMSITASYEGAYGNLTRFIHEVDKSPRFLIIESVTAQPQGGNAQNSATINVGMKLNVFVRGVAGDFAE